MRRSLLRFFSLFLLLFLASCETSQSIVTGIDERESNEIVVYLASKGIVAQKVPMAVSDVAAANAVALYNIMVTSDRSVDAMAILNRVGLPRRMGTNLLELFAKSGLMSSEREETIRYQAGLAEELRNTIRKIDGVLEADVQISFPPSDTSSIPGAIIPKTTAAIYIKHQGILEDPNSHIEVKIKRLMAGSVTGLDFENVSVISDRARFADIVLTPEGEPIGGKALEQTYVSIWGLIMTKTSLARFRLIFFSFIILLLLLCASLGMIVYKFYPYMREKLLKREERSSEELPPPPAT